MQPRFVTKMKYLPRQSLHKQLQFLLVNRKHNVDELQKIFVGRLLVPRLFGVLESAHDRVLAEFDLTVRQASLLASCDLGEAATQAELARIYSLEASSINRMVERLVKKGFLVRHRSKADRRQVFLRITDAGKNCLWEAVPAAVEVARRAWKGVTDQEKAAFESLVNKVVKNLDVTTGPPKHHINHIKK
jgi:DNA-binding MarR family transcriptional regulator